MLTEAISVQASWFFVRKAFPLDQYKNEEHWDLNHNTLKLTKDCRDMPKAVHCACEFSNVTICKMKKRVV